MASAARLAAFWCVQFTSYSIFAWFKCFRSKNTRFCARDIEREEENVLLRASDIEREEENKLLRARILELESPPTGNEPILVDLTESAEESEEEMPPIDTVTIPAIAAPVVAKSAR